MSKALPILEGRLVHRIKRLTAALRASVGSALRGMGVSNPQHTAMVALAANTGASNATLARICSVTPQTMNEIIQGLESAKLVVRLDAEDARREIALQLTDEGKRRVVACQERVVAVEALALASFSEKERRTFLEQLDVCAATLEAGQGEVRASAKAAPRGGARKRPGKAAR